MERGSESWESGGKGVAWNSGDPGRLNFQEVQDCLAQM
jgi:hypothetical protein